MIYHTDPATGAISVAIALALVAAILIHDWWHRRHDKRRVKTTQGRRDKLRSQIRG